MNWTFNRNLLLRIFMKRFFDIFLGLLLLMLLIFPMALISLIVFFISGRPIIFFSERIGADEKIFFMPKFRTMKNQTPNVATHLLKDPSSFYIPTGAFLRKFSLDELPQLFSVVKGDMSLVGPRPALFNQNDLMDLRRASGVEKLKPGITGWAQINGRDEITIEQKVELDVHYMENKNLSFDLYIIWLTVFNVFKSNNISH